MHYSDLASESEEALLDFEVFMLQRRYSDNTIKVYVNALKSFFNFFETTSILELNEYHVNTFNRDFILRKGFSRSYQNQVPNAIKLYYKERKEMELNLQNLKSP